MYACYLRFPGTRCAAEIWSEASRWVGQWYENRPSAPTPPTSWSSGLAEPAVLGPGHRLDCTIAELDGVTLRELRWRYPDDADPSLRWTVEIAVLPQDRTLFTFVQRITSEDFELLPAQFSLRTPRLIRTLVDRGDAYIGPHRLGIEPTYVDVDDIPGFVDFLYAATRRFPVIVFSPDPATGELAVRPEVVAHALAGLARVCVLATPDATYALSDQVGKLCSCYNGAVRIYWPRFADDSDPYFHRLWMPGAVAEMGAEGFAHSLLRFIAAAASFRYVEPEPLRTFRDRLDAARVAAMRASARTGDFDQLFDDYVRIDAQNRELRDRLDASLIEIEELRSRLGGQVAADDTSEPQSVTEAVRAAQRRAQHLVFLDDAIQSAEDSPYQQPDRVYAALLAIDEVARQWSDQLDRGGSLGARRDLFRQRGYDYKEDISMTAEGRYGDEYTYVYGGKRVVFAPHISLGASHQPARSLSIHMHWDQHARRVVIAHVGRHKRNAHS